MILSRFLSRDSLKTRQVHEHLNERETELRNAFLELQKASDRFDKQREELTLQLADLRRQREEVEAQIEQKHIEQSQLEERRRAEAEHILSTIGLAGDTEEDSLTEPAELEELPPGPGDAIPMSYFDKLILVTLMEMGGSGVSRDVKGRIEAKLRSAGKLTPYWEERERTGSRRWQHRVDARRFVLVHEGKLRGSSPRALWELTEAGRRAARENP